MAPTNRLRFNGLLAGAVPPTLAGNISAVAATIDFPAALAYNGGTPVPTIADPDYLPLTIDPDTAHMEIVWLTAYTSGATSGTIAREKEGTTAGSHAVGADVAHSPTVGDFGAITPGDRFVRQQTSAEPVSIAGGGASGGVGSLLDHEEVAADWATWTADGGGLTTISEDGNYAVYLDVYLSFATPPTSGFVDVALSPTVPPPTTMNPVVYVPWDVLAVGLDPYVTFTSFYPAGTELSPSIENYTDQTASVEWARLSILRIG